MAKINPIPTESLKVTMAHSKSWIERVARDAVAGFGGDAEPPQTHGSSNVVNNEQKLFRAIKTAAPPLNGLKKGNVYYCNVVDREGIPYVEVVLKKSLNAYSKPDEKGIIDISEIKAPFTFDNTRTVSISLEGNKLTYSRKYVPNSPSRVSIFIGINLDAIGPNIYIRYSEGKLIVVPPAFCYAPTIPAPDYDNLFLAEECDGETGPFFISNYQMQIQRRSRRVKDYFYKDMTHFIYAKKLTWGKSRKSNKSRRGGYFISPPRSFVFRIRFITQNERKKSRWRVVSCVFGSFTFLS